jgi:hypothetical protein
MEVVRVKLSPATPGQHVDRTLSNLLRNHISQHSWDTLCNDLDKVLGELRRSYVRGGCSFVVSLLLLLLCIGLIFLVESLVSQFPKDASANAVLSISLLWLAFVCCIPYYCHRRRIGTKKKLQCICEQESLKYRNLSFHFREKLYEVNNGKSVTIVIKWYMDIHVCCSSATTAIPLGLVQEETDIAVASTQRNDTDHMIKVSVNLPLSNGNLDRTMSVFLKRHVSEQEWKILLEDLEKVIEERRQVRRSIGWCFFVSASLGVLCVVLVLTVNGVPLSVRITAFFAAPILFLIILCERANYWQRRCNRMKETLQSICSQESLKYKHLCFQFEERIFRSYIMDESHSKIRWNIKIRIFPQWATSLEFVEEGTSMAITTRPFRM